MRIELVRALARSLGIHPAKRSKADLIKTLQLEEGNFDCFASASLGQCDQLQCLWREDCLTNVKGEAS